MEKKKIYNITTKEIIDENVKKQTRTPILKKFADLD